MGTTTKISWTKHTWNPWQGCDKVSPGCAHCYMFTAREAWGQDPWKVTRSKTTWILPLGWEHAAEQMGEKQLVFTCSYSDFFHADADEWRAEAWEIIRRTPHLTYQILTKRPELIRDRLPADWNDGYNNVWLGVSIENPRFCGRRDALVEIPALVHFISAEPLLADISGELNLDHIEWLIVGGESGPGFRPMDYAWARSLRDGSRREGVPFFFKQSAGARSEMGIKLDGRIHHDFPAVWTGGGPRRLAKVQRIL
jgi:protein gp37